MNADQAITISVILIVMTAVYITPTAIAFRRLRSHRWQILVVNIAFGATLVGWVAALLWAIQPTENTDT